MRCKERCPYQGRQPQYMPLNRGILTGSMHQYLHARQMPAARSNSMAKNARSSGTCLLLEGLFCKAASRQPQITACRTAAICSFDANGTRQPLC